MANKWKKRYYDSQDALRDTGQLLTEARDEIDSLKYQIEGLKRINAKLLRELGVGIPPTG